MTKSSDLQVFLEKLSNAESREQPYEALYQLAGKLVGVRIFTIMCVDMNAMLASRAYSNAAEQYPVSGTKPVEMNSWFEMVSNQRKTFVANTLADIADVFPDHELIGSMGCGSVVNLPLECRGQLVATVNLLHEEHYFTQGRVSAVEMNLRLPGLAAWLMHHKLGESMPNS